jgi:predicted 2-oxoglutarate/Fe(II)-dependent dioxygenase YbiX
MYTELAQGVFQYEFPEDLAKTTVKQLNKTSEADWQNSAIGNNEIKSYIRSSQGLPIDSAMPNLAQQIRQNFYSCIKHYTNYFDITVTQDEGLNVLKYEDSDSYDFHTDASWDMYRTVSALIYLNPSQYEGGQTYFKHFDLSVKPNSPSIVLFPSDYAYLHAAMPVTKGKKYVIVSWLNDKPKNLMGHNSGGCACSR